MKSSGIRPHSAFTLIELLVVITIIAILAGMTATVSSRVAASGRVKKATVCANDLVSAWNSYEIAFDDWPLDVGSVGVNWVDFEANGETLKELLGENKLAIPFLNLALKAGDKDDRYLDPWGTPYRYYVRNPKPSGATDPDEIVSVIVTFPNRDRYLR